jgi:chitosanase
MNELQQTTARAIVNVFETGRVLGKYAAIGVLKGDSGHLSYGRSQAALGSGVLFDLLDAYCQKPAATCADALRVFLPRVKNRDVTLDRNQDFRNLLVRAATEDPVMRLTQDQFFDSRYLAPACRAADALGIGEPLGITVIYDSLIQGGWGLLKQKVGAVTTRGSRDWVQRYIDARRTWLGSLKAPLPSTVYRMDAFASLIQSDKWNLELPMAVHNVNITPESLTAEVPDQGARRTLTLTTPYLRGADVTLVQQKLQERQRPITPDGVYGAFTAKLVERWQSDNQIHETGVGPATRQSLGIAA